MKIETERLILREVEESDLQNFYELDSDPEVHRYLGNQPVKNLAESAAMIKDIRQQYQDNGIGRLAVIDKVNQAFLGWSFLKYEKGIREYPYYDIGYRFKKAYWGKGFATETALASLKYGFEELNLSDIYGAADIENIASNKILQKIGLCFVETFLFEGVVHNWYHLKKENWKRSS